MWRLVLDRNGNGQPTAFPSRSHGPDTIYDGLSNTILVTENTNAGEKQQWGDPDPRNCAFVYPLNPDTSGFTAADFYATAPLDPEHPYGTINAARGGPEGERPFPNSNHAGGVNMAFCDGATRTVSDDIDLSVYVRLITPAGDKAGTTITPQSPVDGNSF